jgi:hypothetical protein
MISSLYILLGIIAIAVGYVGWEVYKLMKMDFDFEFHDDD